MCRKASYAPDNSVNARRGVSDSVGMDKIRRSVQSQHLFHDPRGNGDYSILLYSLVSGIHVIWSRDRTPLQYK